jgi:MFS family permease
VSRNALLLGSLAVGVSFLSTAFAIGSSQYAFGLFVPAIEGAFGWTRTHISASLSLTAVGGLVAPLLGRWMDRRGVRQVLTVSVLLMATSFLLRPFMTELWHWYALSTLQFIGFSGASVLAAGKLVGTWFAHARGRAMGIATMGNNFGGLVLPPLVAVVLTAHGWQGAYLALGAIGVAIAVLAVGLVRDAPSAPEVSRDARLAARSAPGAGTAVAGPDGWTAGEALRSRTFYAIVVAVGLGFFTYSAVLPHVTAHLINRGVSAGEASAALSLLAICGMGSKLGFGFLAERFGARRTMMWNLVGQACFTLAMILALDSWLVWVSVPLYGLFMGGFGVLYTLIVQETFGMRHFGSIMGLTNMASIVSFGLGPLVAGYSYDLTGGYATALAIVAGLFLMAAAVLAVVKIPREGHAR